MMTLSEELDLALKELNDMGINYPNPTYVRIKTVKTSLDGIEGMFIKNHAH